MSPVTPAEGGAQAATLAETVQGRDRSSEEIRADIVRQRQQLSNTVDALRGKVGELTDVSYQARRHRGKLLAGAAVAGFVVGGLIALRRRSNN